jgi:hypothetical protein
MKSHNDEGATAMVNSFKGPTAQTG